MRGERGYIRAMSVVQPISPARAFTHVTVALVVLGAACHQEPEPAAPAQTTEPVRPASAGTCAPASVSHGATCPARPVPPGTGSSPEGCKSDADCTDGKEGRCVKNGVAFQWEQKEMSHPSNLLAAPPPPPLRSVCVYDRCQSDGECGPQLRCECRSGVATERNRCLPLDTCVSDRDCANDTLCVCGASGMANACARGNCRANADCGGFACDPDHMGARYCRTSRDTCTANSQCKTDVPYGQAVCAYKTETHAYGCSVLLPPPPG